MKSPVYEEYKAELVESNHGSDVYYRVFAGTVNRSKSSDSMKRAITVMMQYGHTPDWRSAVAHKEISFDMPAHILLEDLPAVLSAISRLSEL